MSVLSAYFDVSIDQRSPVQIDYNRIVKYDEKGNEVITFEEMDYSSFQKSLGNAICWNLDELLKAGINPDFGIHTGYNTRLEGINAVNDFVSMADSILENDSENNSKSE